VLPECKRSSRPRLNPRGNAEILWAKPGRARNALKHVSMATAPRLRCPPFRQGFLASEFLDSPHPGTQLNIPI